MLQNCAIKKTTKG